MVVANLDKRVNLRIDEDTYEAYEKVASFFNRTTADLMREALQGGVSTMQTLGSMIDRAKAGDKEAVQSLFDSLLNMHQGALANARVRMDADLATAAEQEGADSNSNTVR
jgi:predicted DNA-binding protein